MANESATERLERVDPRSAYPRPPFRDAAASARASTRSGADRLVPAADHGEGSYVGAGRLAGLRTVVTGGDSGIGRAVALAFAREGADVLIAYLDQGADAEASAALVEAAGRRAATIAGDLGDERHCRAIVEQARDEFGRIDVLVNNAATQSGRDSIEEIPTEEWERILRTNLTAPFLLSREALRAMGPGASIINVASIQAATPSPRLLAYATTKGGLVTFSKGLATMLAPRGIRVNVVAPGPVWTPLVATTTAPDELERFGADSPLGRPAQPVELAGAFVFLASPAASYITGTVIAVTGGQLFL